MKKIVVSLMLIALMAGLISGGLFADFSDIETSHDNYFSSGSMDLKVSNYLGMEYEDPNVPMFFQIENAWPCCSKDVRFDLHNVGQGFQQNPWLYLHIKNLVRTELANRPEPEVAVEDGGRPIGELADGTPVSLNAGTTGPPNGKLGVTTNLDEHVSITIEKTQVSSTGHAQEATGWVNVIGPVKLNTIVCN